MTIVVALVALMTAQVTDHVQSKTPTPVLSVCDVLATDPTKLNGRVITVRGQLGSTYHGMYLISECKTHLLTKGLKWGNDISVYAEVADENVARPWDRFGKELTRLHADLRRDKVIVTIVGRLETRDSLNDMVVPGPDGPARLGFGHMNGSPAEIDLLSIEVNEVNRAHVPPR